MVVNGINNAPPPAIGSERVIAYAIVDRSVRYTGTLRLYEDSVDC